MKKIYLILSLIYLLISISDTYTQYYPEWIQSQGIDNERYNTVKMVRDINNNVFITGTKYYTNNIDIFIFKYNALGILLWQRIVGLPNIDSANFLHDAAIDNSGNLYITGEVHEGGNRGPDILVMKLDPIGTIIFETHFSNNTYYSRDIGYSIAVDNTGNSYVTGIISTNYSMTDSLVIIKFNPAGGLLWYKAYSGNYGYLNEGSSITMDYSNNVLVTGYVHDSSYYKSVFIKLNSSGAQQWIKYYYYPDNILKCNRGYNILTDNLSNVYATGFSQGNNIETDSSNAFLIKFSQDGIQQWVNNYKTPGKLKDSGKEIVFDQSQTGIIILSETGKYYDPYSQHDISLIKYSSAGSFVWARRYDEGSNNFESGNKILIDNANNILIAGSANTYFRKDIILLKYSQAGDILTNSKFNITGTSTDEAVYALQNTDNSLILAGNNIISPTQTRCFAMKLLNINSSIKTFYFQKNNLNKQILDLQAVYDTINVNIPGNQYMMISDVNLIIDTVLHTFDSNLDFSLTHMGITDTAIYRSGGSLDNFIGTILDDSALVQIGSSGTLPPYTGKFKPFKPLYAFNYINPNGNWILKIYDNENGNTGMLKAWSLQIVYSFPIGIKPITSEIPKSFSLSQNYPNPFNPTTKIRFALPPSPQGEGLGARVIVYDILGCEITVLVNEQLKPGTYEVTWDASNFSSGVYFYKLTAWDPTLRSGQSYIESKKMVLLK